MNQKQRGCESLLICHNEYGENIRPVEINPYLFAIKSINMKLENRFKNKLQKDHQIIADFSHGNNVLKIITAMEIKKIIEKKKTNVLEIGCGEGNFTKYLLKYNQHLNLDILDVSPEMIESAKIKLSDWKSNINFICEDALKFLKNSIENYDIIVSSWTLHNFKWDEKMELFKHIHNRLNKAGRLFLLDKIYSDVSTKNKEQMDKLCGRYDNYLPAELKKEIISHAKKDFSIGYRMDENNTLAQIAKLGFKKIKIIDREAEEAILTACKE